MEFPELGFGAPSRISAPEGGGGEGTGLLRIRIILQSEITTQAHFEAFLQPIARKLF